MYISAWISRFFSRKKCFERIGGIEMKQRIPEIDVLRGLGIVFVLLGHAIIVYPINLHSIPIFQFAFNIVSSVHIYLLFLLMWILETGLSA